MCRQSARLARHTRRSVAAAQALGAGVCGTAGAPEEFLAVLAGLARDKVVQQRAGLIGHHALHRGQVVFAPALGYVHGRICNHRASHTRARATHVQVARSVVALATAQQSRSGA